jgi:hypothetical protein
VKHQQAACKNAFVLMGNHRPELAAAFFILGKEERDLVLSLFIFALLQCLSSSYYYLFLPMTKTLRFNFLSFFRCKPR